MCPEWWKNIIIILIFLFQVKYALIYTKKINHLFWEHLYKICYIYISYFSIYINFLIFDKDFFYLQLM